MKCTQCGKEFRVPKKLTQGKERQRYCCLSCASGVKTMLRSGKSGKAKSAPTRIKLSPKHKYPKNHKELRAFRCALDINQRDFWARLGVTQSGGSRYENNRPLPPPVAILLDAVYIKGISLARLTLNDCAILEYLKAQQPDLYASLDKAVSRADKFID